MQSRWMALLGIMLGVGCSDSDSTDGTLLSGEDEARRRRCDGSLCDAGSLADARLVTDSGTPVDSGSRVDSGSPGDSGSVPDDSGSQVDSGPVADSGSTADAGPVPVAGMPIGIPAPPFGINEQAPAAPNPWDATHTTSGGSQFYYVCPTCAGHTDSSNPFGTPAKPRDTVPGSISAGSVVEVHGQIDTNASFTANGTMNSPVFVRGANATSKAKFTAEMSISGSYVVMENVHWGPANASDGDFGVHVSEGNHHIALRSCEASGNSQATGGVGVGSWSYGGGQSASYVVIQACAIHNLGLIQAGVDTDAHGVTLNGAVDHFWLLDSDLYANVGDGIQVEAQHGNMAKIHHVYLGRNKSHGNKQSSMWVKHATDVVISQNELYQSQTIDSFSAGQCTGFQYNPNYVWFLYNKIHDCNVGIAVSSDDGSGEGTESYFIGNVIYNIHAATTNPYDSGSMSMRGGLNHYIINNTLYDFDSGLNFPPGGGNYQIVNNIISGRANSSTCDIYMEDGGEASRAVVQFNDFFSTSGVRFSWGGATYTSLASLQAAGKGQSCKSADPLFTNAAAYDLTLKAGSPARDAGTAHAAYATFQSRYGIDIAVDAARTARPQGGAWDMGSYEGN